MPDGNDYEFSSDSEATRAMVAWNKQFGDQQMPTPPVEDNGSLIQSLVNMRKQAGNIVGAVGEPLAQMATGMIAKPISEIAGLAATGTEMVSPQGGDPEAFKRYVAEKLTYQPKTEWGASPYNPINAAMSAVGGAVGKGGELIREGAKDITGSDIAAAGAEEAAMQSLGFLGLKGVPKKTPLIGKEANLAKVAELQRLKAENAILDEVRKRAKAAGFKTPAEGGIKAVAQRMVTGGEKNLNLPNEIVATRNAAKELELPGGVLNDTTLEAAKSKAYDAYKNVIKAAYRKIKEKKPSGFSTEWETIPSVESRTAGMVMPEGIRAQIRGKIAEIERAIDEYPELNKSKAEIVRLLEDVAKKKEFDPQLAMEQIKEMRAEAGRVYKSQNALPDQIAIARAKQGIADLLENTIEESVKDNKGLYNEFVKQRKKLAQIHFVDEAFNEATGRIEIPKAVSAARKYPVTGELKTIVDVGLAYPGATQKARGAVAAISPIDVLFSTGAFASGHGVLGAAELAGKIALYQMARGGLLSSRKPSYKLSKTRKAAGVITGGGATPGLFGMTIPQQIERERGLLGVEQ